MYKRQMSGIWVVKKPVMEKYFISLTFQPIVLKKTWLKR